jgi:hypothetical protein
LRLAEVAGSAVLRRRPAIFEDADIASFKFMPGRKIFAARLFARYNCNRFSETEIAR